MPIIKALTIFVAVQFLFLVSFSQIDTSKVGSVTVLKKGFYKSYEEFLANSPSITAPFAVTQYVKSKRESTVVGATYAVDENTIIDRIWGFCDGTSVYVSYNHSVLKRKYWKLDYTGPYSTFSYAHKDIWLIGSPVTALVTGITTAAADNVEFDLMTVNEHGRCVPVTIPFLKKALAKQPDLLQKFKAEIEPYDLNDGDVMLTEEMYSNQLQILRRYLGELNKRSK